MSYRDRQRLSDIQAAIDAIRSHLERGDLSDGLIFDAVRIRLLEIGEAVKALPDDLLATQPTIPWRQIARMRDHLAHRYFDTTHAILQATVDKDLPDLERATAPASHSTSPAPSGSTPAGSSQIQGLSGQPVLAAKCQMEPGQQNVPTFKLTLSSPSSAEQGVQSVSVTFSNGVQYVASFYPVTVPSSGLVTTTTSAAAYPPNDSMPNGCTATAYNQP